MANNTTFGSIDPDVYESAWDLFSPFGSPDLDELDITVAIQVSVLSASVDNVAWLLSDFEDVLALGLGFRFPHERRDEYLSVSESRVNDPDVVAIRGMAAAALSLVNSTKMADVFLISIYGPGITNNLHTKWTKSVSLDFFYNVCTPNFKLELDDYGIPNCHVEEYFEQLRRNLTETFNDGDLMQRVLDTEPEPVLQLFRYFDKSCVLGRACKETSGIDDRRRKASGQLAVRSLL